MTLILPDPDPGRCPNYTGGVDAYGYPRQKRCLDYAGHPDACTFEADPEPISREQQGTYSHTPKPKAWVSPLKKRHGGSGLMGDRTDESGMTVSCERAKGWPGQTITMTVDEAMEVAGLLNVLADQRDLQGDIRAAAMTWVKRLVHWPAQGGDHGSAG